MRSFGRALGAAVTVAVLGLARGAPRRPGVRRAAGGIYHDDFDESIDALQAVPDQGRPAVSPLVPAISASA